MLYFGAQWAKKPVGLGLAIRIGYTDDSGGILPVNSYLLPLISLAFYRAVTVNVSEPLFDL